MREILSHDVPRPGSSWRQITPRDIPKVEHHIPQWISRHRPMLVQVVVRETHPALHRLINPGADLRQEQSQRLWRTSDEIGMLSHFSKLRILDAWEVDETINFLKESDGLGKALALDDEAQEANRATPILLAHGSLDPLVPIALGLESRDYLRARGYGVEWRDYPMPHAVCPQEISDVRDWLATVVRG